MRTESPRTLSREVRCSGTVCRDLLTKAVERGLDASAGLLFVLDGAKALHAAVRDVFDGQPVQIQRCRRHKSENIVGYLPAAEKGWVRRQLAAAWAEPDPTEARAALNELARKLDRLNPTPPGRYAKDSRRPSPSTGSASPAPSAAPWPRRTRWSPPSTSSDRTQRT